MTIQKTSTLLLVDGNPDNLSILQQVLCQYLPDCEVQTARSADECLTAATTIEIDVILINYQMPDMAGIEICRLLKSNPDIAQVPVLLLTDNYTSSKNKEEGLEAGVNDFISRPIDNIELVARIKTILRLKKTENQLRIANAETKKLQEQRTTSLRDYQNAVESSDDLIVTVNSQFIYMLVNEAFLKYYGLKRHQVVGHSVSEILGKEVFETGLKPNFSKCLTGETVEFEISKSYAGLGLRHLHVRYTPLRGSAELIEGVVATIRDITDFKKAKKELQDSEERWKFAIEGSAAGVWDWDVQTNETFFSERWKSILGYEENEIGTSGEEWTKRVHPDDMEMANKEIQRHFQGEVPFYSFEHRMLCKDGTYKWFLGRGKVITRTADGQPSRMVGTNTDITERKQAEQEKRELEAHLQQAYKMEAIGTMAGGIAHDFNNLLAIIRGNVDIILRKQKNGRPFDRNLEYINQSTSRAIELVKQILAFSRQEHPALTTVDLAIVTKGSLRLLRSTIPSSVGIMSTVANGTVLVNADATQVQQIIINLCTNAVHAMKAKGLLTVNLHEVELSAREIPTTVDRPAGRYTKLTVTDTGSGMDKETIARIFEPFFTTKDVGEGTGMGLSVVYGIVDAHGGFIAIDSTLGKGTSFNIYFPSITDRREKVEGTTTQALPLGTERILFVDDEKDVAAMCTELLEYQGYIVTSTTSSIAALATFKSNPEIFDLVFTDQTMPEMTGSELAAELLKIRPDIPIILCSGYSATTTEKDPKSIGIRKFCTKPMNRSQLALIVRKVLDDGPLS